jgi:hypothetical protein
LFQGAEPLMPFFRTLLAVIVTFLTGAGLQFIHPLAQAAAYHHFADCRAIGPIHNAADVLSNLVILLAGLANLTWVDSHARQKPVQLCGMAVVAVGLVLTSAGSAYYHFSPSDATLIWDRLPITIVFAGILAMLWSSVTGKSAGWASTLLLVAGSAGSVLYWAETGSLWPYALLQFGGMASLAGLTIFGKVDNPRAWAFVIGWYALAKVFEMYDFQVWLLTGNLFAGHAIKHITSGFAGLALFGVVSKSAPAQPATPKSRLF